MPSIAHIGKTNGQITVIKANGQREPFEEDKLRASLINSGASEEDTQKVLDRTLPTLHNGMTTADIYSHAFAVLAGINRPVAHSYSLRRAVMDLGPSGFPFEDFVAEIFKAKGYTTLTRQTLLGQCVPHEVDVVAFDQDKLFIVEAKFHNELGTKSDLKVALYIKARFDDLKNNVYSYGGSHRKITDAWLITNTKFSSTAIHYGVCQNLTMIGWGYPDKGNLKDMIEELKLHPVTCLASLSSAEKQILVSNGVVLCSNVIDNPDQLRKHLGRNYDIAPIISEINELY